MMMKRYLMIMAFAGALVSCTDRRTDGAGTLRIRGESAGIMAVRTRAEGQKTLAELGETVPDPAGLHTLISCKGREWLLDGENPWKEYASVSAANGADVLYMPADYIVTLASAAFPSYKDLSSGQTVSSTERPYYTGGGTLVPQVAEGRHLPYFEGRAEVTMPKSGNVTAHVTLGIANTAVCIRFTDAFRHYFENGAEFQIKTRSLGDGADATTAGNTFTVTYDSGEGDLFWIRPQGFVISGTATRQDPSPGIIDAKPIRFEDYTAKDADVKPQTLYTYTFDIQNAGSTSGEGGGIRVTLNDEPIEIIEEDVELNPNAPIEY